MAVKIRLARRGRKRKPIYDIVVADSRSPRDGKFIEKLGTFNPNVQPESILLNEESAFNWVMKGALPTDSARTILSREGIMLRKHLQVGVNKGAISQETADQRFEAWKNDKQAKLNQITADLAKAKADEAQKVKQAEQAKAKAMADAQAKAAAEAQIEESADSEEAPAEEAEAPAEEGTEEKAAE